MDPFGGRAAANTQLRQPRTVAVFDEYLKASRALRYLIDKGLSSDSLRLEGHDLKVVERMSKQFPLASFLIRGVLNGIVYGALLMLLSSFTKTEWVSDPMMRVLVSFGIGMACGLVIAALQYLALRGRNRAVERIIVADTYKVLAESDIVVDARSLLYQANAQVQADRRGIPVERLYQADQHANRQADQRVDQPADQPANPRQDHRFGQASQADSSTQGSDTDPSEATS